MADTSILDISKAVWIKYRGLVIKIAVGALILAILLGVVFGLTCPKKMNYTNLEEKQRERDPIMNYERNYRVYSPLYLSGEGESHGEKDPSKYLEMLKDKSAFFNAPTNQEPEPKATQNNNDSEIPAQE
jgi:hypothetical protein